MAGDIINLLGNSLGKFIKYTTLVDLSSKLNYPLIPPITASVSITQFCNSKCSYCDIWRLEEDFQEVSLDNLDIIFKSLKKLGVKLVSLTGGEPLTRFDLDEIISLAKYYGLIVHVGTNGILLTKERALKLKEAGVDNITLSMDSFDPIVYEGHRGVPFKFVEQALSSLLYIVNKYPSLWCNITCVVTRNNIGTLVDFVTRISEYGGGKISVTLQPYHKPLSFSELIQLTPKLQRRQNELLHYYQEKSSNDGIIPGQELRPAFEKEIQELIQLKKGNLGFKLNNSEYYLRSMPDFLFDNKLPDGLNCVSGYTGVVIRSDLEVCSCWRLPSIGNLEEEELKDIWYSQRFRKSRIAMKHLECSGCMLLCHNEPGFNDLHNTLYRSHQNQND